MTYSMSADAFVRSVGVNTSAPYSILIGAGASTSSGVPSAATCIWEWKRKIFLTNNPGLESQFSDLSLTSVRARIQKWLDSDGHYLPESSPEEYSFYVERCFPIPEDRRRYFQELVQNATPYIGYDLLCMMASAQLITSAWTPNFDGLVAKAASTSKITAIEVGLDSSIRLDRARHRDELLCVALHGDYRYDALKNTASELRDQNQKLIDNLKNTLLTSSLIVSGYSGRDDSIMNALHEAFSAQGVGRLFWCGYEDVEPDARVASLLNTARQRGREAYYIATQGFDDIMLRLALHCLKGALLSEANKLRLRALERTSLDPPAFTLDVPRVTAIIRSNAFEVDCPSEVLQFVCKDLQNPGTWDHIDHIISGREIVAVPLRGKVLAFGQISEIKSAFGKYLVGGLTSSPVTDDDLVKERGAIISLMVRAVVRSIAKSANLETDGRRLLWRPTPYRSTTVFGEQYECHESALIGLRRYADRMYLLIKPTVRAQRSDGEDVSIEVTKEIRRQILTYQYNKQFLQAVGTWRNIILGDSGVYEYPPNSASPFKFVIQRVPALAKIGAINQRSSIPVTPNLQRFVAYAGVEFAEPQLIFSNTGSDGYVTDSHPMRGIVQNQPYDYALTRRGLDHDLRIGVVCPSADSNKLASYLSGLQLRRKVDSKDEYLLDYPGFSTAFGLPLDVPQPGSNAWAMFAEPRNPTNNQDGAAQLSHQLIESIKSLRASASPSVIIIYVPERWRHWNRYIDENHRFDLHDHVKAYCVQQGIATQLIREATLTKRYQCEIHWWLALSLYAKSMHTPWALDNLDQDTSFMGLGYSVDAHADVGNHIVLGCSHIYGSDGVGLRYKLSKIDQFAIRQGNPYMSRDDARRVGDGARQLFFESMQRLPRRVVIHKRTPFNDEERDGLLEGLAGVEIIDLLEISIDSELRFVASQLGADGKFHGDNYPVRRGTTIVLDKRRALIWVHGTAEPVEPTKRPYYQGKSRIPAPLVITRHHGTSELSVLAREVLGLSKMNWNTFDMYTRVPATIESSNEIAKIGALLERFGTASYDYRLFI